MASTKAKAEQLQDKEILTSELAAIVGKTPQWIRQLTRDGVLKQVGRGKYVLADAVQAYIDHASGGKEDDKKPRFIDEKTEHERIKKEMAALELSKMRNELHAADDVRAVMSDMLTAFRQKMLTIPTKLSPQLTGVSDINEIKSRLTKEVQDALAELADYSPGMFEEGAAGVDVDAES